MKLDSKYHIEADRLQYMLRKKGSKIKSGDRKGEWSYETIAYHGDIKKSIKKYLELDVKKAITDVGNAEELLQKFTDLEKYIDEKLEMVTEGINLELINKKQEELK